jgi:hypothetical protein
MLVNDEVILESSCSSIVSTRYTTVHPPKQAQLALSEPQLNDREYFEASTMGSTQGELIIRARNSQPHPVLAIVYGHILRETIIAHNPVALEMEHGMASSILAQGSVFAEESLSACQCSMGHLFKLPLWADQSGIAFHALFSI